MYVINYGRGVFLSVKLYHILLYLIQRSKFTVLSQTPWMMLWWWDMLCCWLMYCSWSETIPEIAKRLFMDKREDRTLHFYCHCSHQKLKEHHRRANSEAIALRYLEIFLKYVLFWCFIIHKQFKLLLFIFSIQCYSLILVFLAQLLSFLW